MNVTAPHLSEGTDFRVMAVAESGGIYRFKLLKSAIFTFKEAIISPPRRLSFRTDGKEWLRIEPHRMIVARGYAWNGNSVKKGIRVLGRDIWMGTPDFIHGTLAASLIHDSLFQYSGLYQMPLWLDDANDIYEACCRQNKFPLTPAYMAALNEFSPAFWGKFQPDQTCHEI